MLNQTAILLPKEYETANGVHILKALRNHYVDVAFQVGLYSNVILIPIGIILNILSFIIFYKIKTYKSATGLHLMCMAIADNFALIGIFLFDVPAYSIYSFIPDIHALHIFFCKSIPIFGNGAVLWCGLLLASATVERFICVAFALKVKSWNLLKLSKLLLTAYYLLSFCLNIPLYLDHQIVNMNNVKTCIVIPDGTVYVPDFIVNGILSNVVVLIIILFFTVAIAIHLYKFKQQRNDLSQNMSNGDNKEFMITAMLFNVACLFLVTKIPIVIVSEIGKNIQPEDFDVEIFRHLLVAWIIGTLLQVISHSTNLIIYVIFFKEFKDTFVDFCTNRTRNGNRNANRQSPRHQEIPG